MVASHVPPTGDLAHNPGMCLDWELNWQPFSLQVGAQFTEPHQPVSLIQGGRKGPVLQPEGQEGDGAMPRDRGPGSGRYMEGEDSFGTPGFLGMKLK